MKKLAPWGIVVAAVTSWPVLPARSQPAVPAAVAACSANPAICAVVVSGAAWYVYWRHRPPLYCTWGGCRPFYSQERPGDSGEWDEPIIAQDPVWAERVCRDLARRYNVRYVRTQQPRKTRKGQTQQYRCWFSSR